MDFFHLSLYIAYKSCTTMRHKRTKRPSHCYSSHKSTCPFSVCLRMILSCSIVYERIFLLISIMCSTMSWVGSMSDLLKSLIVITTNRKLQHLEFLQFGMKQIFTGNKVRRLFYFATHVSRKIMLS